jgi:hypothetical protein
LWGCRHVVTGTVQYNLVGYKYISYRYSRDVFTGTRLYKIVTGTVQDVPNTNVPIIKKAYVILKLFPKRKSAVVMIAHVRPFQFDCLFFEKIEGRGGFKLNKLNKT